MGSGILPVTSEKENKYLHFERKSPMSEKNSMDGEVLDNTKISTPAEEYKSDEAAVHDGGTPEIAVHKSDSVKETVSVPKEDAVGIVLPVSEQTKDDGIDASEDKKTEPKESAVVTEDAVSEPILNKGNLPPSEEFITNAKDPTLKTGDDSRLPQVTEDFEDSKLKDDVVAPAPVSDLEKRSDTDEDSALQNKASVPKDVSSEMKKKHTKSHSDSVHRAEYRIKNVRDLFRNRLLGSALLFVVSLIILIGALFVPLSHSTVELKEGVEGEVTFSGIDSFSLFYYSTQSLTDSQIRTTRLYKDTMQLYKLYGFYGSSDFVVLVQPDSDVLDTIAENMLILKLINSETELRVAVVFAALVSVLFIIISALLFLRSLSAFISEILAFAKNKNTVRKKKSHSPIHTLWFLTALIPLLAYSFSQMSYWGVSNGLSSFSSLGNGMSGGIALISVFAVLGSVYFAASAVITSTSAAVYKGGLFKRRLIFLCIILVLFISLFLPVMNITVRGGVSATAKTQTVSVTIDDLYALSGDDTEYYYNISDGENMEKVTATIRKLLFASKKPTTKTFLNDLVIGAGGNDISGMYLAIQLIMYAILLSFAFMLKYSLQLIWQNADNGGKIKKTKILLAFLVFAEAVLEIILMIVSGFSLPSDLSMLVSFDVGIGPLLCIASSVVLLFFKTEPVAKGAYMDDWYDNADVSYAPYVVRNKR